MQWVGDREWREGGGEVRLPSAQATASLRWVGVAVGFDFDFGVWVAVGVCGWGRAGGYFYFRRLAAEKGLLTSYLIELYKMTQKE